MSTSDVPSSRVGALETKPVHLLNEPHGNIPNTPLASACISFFLGAVFTLGFLLFIFNSNSWWWSSPQLGFFLASWAAFHWGEFVVTAGWNRNRVSVDSYLLDNGAAYHIANGTALVEFLLETYFVPSYKSLPVISSIGMMIVIASQALRSAAMIQAGSNFSHTVSMKRAAGHQLVTHGVYAWCRHPAYTGFFYWGIGTQLVLQNPISFVGFSLVLWRFFYIRIQREEWALVHFFGDDYKTYKKRVGTYIPFIP